MITRYVPRSSRQSKECPNDVAPERAPATLSSRSFHGGTMNARYLSLIAQSWISVNCGVSRGSDTTFSTRPSGASFATWKPTAGGLHKPQVYSRPSLASFLACALKPIGRFGPNTRSPTVSSDSGSTSMGAPPSQSTRSLPAWNNGDVFAGLVGKLKRLARLDLAWVHAPRTATPASSPALSCFASRGVRTILHAARAVFDDPSSSAPKIMPSPSNQCAYRSLPTRMRPGPTR
mmetsp:Transcript_11005/g.42848  ORF Transcript_11005/g.42848 Transcript_11005/m.42848 type:complete len:233 (+) Transcript_11005:975-1673(+)